MRVCGECEHKSSPTEELGTRLCSERAQDGSERFREGTLDKALRLWASLSLGVK